VDERYPSTEHDRSEYCFFSLSKTIGHVIASQTNGLDLARNHLAELLVVLEDANSGTVLRRLPTTMHLYVAKSKYVMKDFDQVIVRIYDTTESTATETIDVIKSDQKKDISTCSDKVSNGSVNKEQEILKAIHDLDSNAKPKAVSMKVHQLLVKGKAKGDKKIRVNDRFYFEKISIVRDLKLEAKSEFVFVDGGECITHVLPLEKDCFSLQDDVLTSIDVRNSTGRIDCVIAPYSRIITFCF
jgi:hypothetical protein